MSVDFNSRNLSKGPNNSRHFRETLPHWSSNPLADVFPAALPCLSGSVESLDELGQKDETTVEVGPSSLRLGVCAAEICARSRPFLIN